MLWHTTSPLFIKDKPIRYSTVIDALNDAAYTFRISNTEVEHLVWMYLQVNNHSVYDSMFDIFLKYKLIEETLKPTSFEELAIIFKTPSPMIQRRIDKAVLIYKVKKL